MSDICNYCGDDEDKTVNNLCNICAIQLAEMGAL